MGGTAPGAIGSTALTFGFAAITQRSGRESATVPCPNTAGNCATTRAIQTQRARQTKTSRKHGTGSAQTAFVITSPGQSAGDGGEKLLTDWICVPNFFLRFWTPPGTRRELSERDVTFTAELKFAIFRAFGYSNETIAEILEANPNLFTANDTHVDTSLLHEIIINSELFKVTNRT